MTGAPAQRTGPQSQTPLSRRGYIDGVFRSQRDIVRARAMKVAGGEAAGVVGGLFFAGRNMVSNPPKEPPVRQETSRCPKCGAWPMTTRFVAATGTITFRCTE